VNCSAGESGKQQRWNTAVSDVSIQQEKSKGAYSQALMHKQLFIVMKIFFLPIAQF